MCGQAKKQKHAYGGISGNTMLTLAAAHNKAAHHCPHDQCVKWLGIDNQHKTTAYNILLQQSRELV
jgi:hypothetical protein